MKNAEYLEKKRHGSYEFPIQYYYVDKKHPQYVMPPHWHKEFEIIKVSDGFLNVSLNGVEYSLKKGDILFVECGCLHKGEPYDCVYECIVFDLNMLSRTQNDAAGRYVFPIINSTAGVNCLLDYSNNALYSAVNAMFAEMCEQKKFYELRVYSLLFKIFAELYSENYVISSAKSKHSNQAKTVTRLIDWIEKNIKENFSLEMLSEISGLSPKYICRIFKEYTSKTVIDYVNELRIENACYELDITPKSITQIAYDNGFNDLSYFCKIFKRYKGITPKEYKTAKRERLI